MRNGKLVSEVFARTFRTWKSRFANHNTTLLQIALQASLHTHEMQQDAAVVWSKFRIIDSWLVPPRTLSPLGLEIEPYSSSLPNRHAQAAVSLCMQEGFADCNLRLGTSSLEASLQ